MRSSVDHLHSTSCGLHFELTQIRCKVALGGDVGGFGFVEIDQLQPPYSQGCQLQRHLPPDSTHTNYRDPTTAGDFCRRFSEARIQKLMDALHKPRLKVWQQQPDSFFDLALSLLA